MDCPHLDDFDPASPDSIDRAFARAPALPFTQSWLEKNEPRFASGSVRIGWRGDRFCFDATLQDAVLFTTATRRNEPLFELGDTLEFFAGTPGDPSYIEYHYAPNGVIFQLLWPAHARSIDLPAAGGLQSFAIEDDQSTHAIHILEKGWRVCASVRSPALLNAQGTLEGTTIEFHFGRYDYSNSTTPPVLSTTAPLPRRCFHDRPNWSRTTCRPANTAA